MFHRKRQSRFMLSEFLFLFFMSFDNFSIAPKTLIKPTLNGNYCSETNLEFGLYVSIRISLKKHFRNLKTPGNHHCFRKGEQVFEKLLHLVAIFEKCDHII